MNTDDSKKEKSDDEKVVAKPSGFDSTEISNNLEEWMTEKTDPRLPPRSDCG